MSLKLLVRVRSDQSVSSLPSKKNKSQIHTQPKLGQFSNCTLVLPSISDNLLISVPVPRKYLGPLYTGATAAISTINLDNHFPPHFSSKHQFSPIN